MSEQKIHRQATIERLAISPELYDDYKDAFDYYDKDKSGDISFNELASLFRSLGHSIPDSEIRDMIDSIDDSGDGAISFDEFINMMVEKFENKEEPKEEPKEEEPTPVLRAAPPKKKGNEIPDDDDEIIKAFALFDTDKSGTLNKIELRYILTRIGDRFTDAEVDDIFKQADLDGNGEIDYKEFVAYWRKNFII